MYQQIWQRSVFPRLWRRVGGRWRLPQPARRGVLMHLFGLPQAFGGATPHPTRSLHHLSWDIKTTCTTTIDISKSYHLQYITMASPNYAHSETHLCAAKQPQYLHNVHQAFVTCASMLMLTYSCSSTTAMVKDGVAPSAAIPEVGDVELLKVPPWIIGKVFCEPNDFLIRWTTMASTVVKCVLHYVAMYVLLPHLILRPLVTHMDVSKVNWHEGRTSILPGVYQDNCNYICKPSAAVTKGDISDTFTSRLRPCRTQH